MLSPLRLLNKGVIAGVSVSILSFFFSIVPCTTAPVIANPEYKFGMCKLPNPFQEPLLGISQKFYTFSTEPLAGLILQFLASFLLFTLIFLVFRKKARKTLDLSRRR